MQDFERSLEAFESIGVAVVGVSTDPQDVNRGFKEKLGARFPLLSDEGGDASRQLGILQQSGRAARTTFLIDRTGKAAKIFTGVKVDGHVQAVLEAAKEMQGSQA